MSRPDSDDRWTWRERLTDWLTRIQFLIYTVLVLLLITMGALWHRSFIVVPPGNLGVVFRTIFGGTDVEHIWSEGIHVIPPWDHMTFYDVRLQQRTIEFKVLSDEGLLLGIHVVVRFRLNPDLLGYLQKDIGAEYFERLIKPEIESQIRHTFGNRPAHELYATVREVFQELNQFSVLGRFEKSEKGTISRPYVSIQDLKLVIIELPKIVENAILEKYQQEQLMLAYKYKLAREEKEADRKRIESAGIRDFNQIAGKNMDIMRWRSLEVASEFAKSPNSKVVVLGGGQGTMPMILNLGDTAQSAVPAPAADTVEPARQPEKTRPRKAGTENASALPGTASLGTTGQAFDTADSADPSTGAEPHPRKPVPPSPLASHRAPPSSLTQPPANSQVTQAAAPANPGL